jgi:hypothetical protein
MTKSNPQEQPANLAGIAFNLKRSYDGPLMAGSGQTEPSFKA